ncbi:LysO family transporter [Orenia marismortui]|uniref:Lysine exporter LysO-like protein n=1 Tax=Orenia marismortui TaxID=46469 RepID=A0A4R8HAR3_9FIRM|nr:LysO family transporter [Orenia marismortui]TDX53025.1 lysine exporter LysO-like protein [Orenia marismortui]
MWVIILSLLMGILIGYIDILPNRLNKLSDKLTLVGLMILLLVMGIKIGISKEIINNLDSLGLKAIILSIGSILGSVLLLLFVEVARSSKGD